MNKQELRKEILKSRKNIDIAIISNKIVNNIKNNQKYHHAKHIMIFYPMEYEIDVLELLKDTGKIFYLPRINGNILEVCPYKLNDELFISEFKTREPKTHAVDKNILDVVIVPALCADKDNYRLGYGKGFYDRFLKDLSAYKIVPVASNFLFEKLPFDEFDEKVDLIITENY